VVGFSIVTIGDEASRQTAKLFEAGDFTKYLYLHGLSVETAEALAELAHKQAREYLGIAGGDSPLVTDLFHQKYHGSRYSFVIRPAPILKTRPKSSACSSRKRTSACGSPSSSTWSPSRAPTPSSCTIPRPNILLCKDQLNFLALLRHRSEQRSYPCSDPMASAPKMRRATRQSARPPRPHALLILPKAQGTLMKCQKRGKTESTPGQTLLPAAARLLPRRSSRPTTMQPVSGAAWLSCRSPAHRVHARPRRYGPSTVWPPVSLIPHPARV